MNKELGLGRRIILLRGRWAAPRSAVAPLGTKEGVGAWGPGGLLRPGASCLVSTKPGHDQSPLKDMDETSSTGQTTSDSIVSETDTTTGHCTRQGAQSTRACRAPQGRMHSCPPADRQLPRAWWASMCGTLSNPTTYHDACGMEPACWWAPQPGAAHVPKRKSRLCSRFPRGLPRHARTCLLAASVCHLLPGELQFPPLPAAQQSQLLGVPATQQLPQLCQGCLLLPLQVGLCQLQLCCMCVAQTQAQRLQLQGGHRLWGWDTVPTGTSVQVPVTASGCPGSMHAAPMASCSPQDPSASCNPQAQPSNSLATHTSPPNPASSPSAPHPLHCSSSTQGGLQPSSQAGPTPRGPSRLGDVSRPPGRNMG